MRAGEFQTNISREGVADHFGLTPNHVSRFFRQEGRTSFSDYLKSVRINRAKFMLHNYRLTLKEIAGTRGSATSPISAAFLRR